jgi:cephalosporin hydroxylase
MTTFLGFEMLQSWDDLQRWEFVFSNYHLGSLMELGTWKGGMALYFALQCERRDIACYTFDSHDRTADQWFMDEHVHPTIGDIFNEGFGEVAYRIQHAPRPLMLFCDNGDKRREWNTFGPLLQAGDYIAVHDWCSEFFPTDVVGFAVESIFVPEQDRSVTRWFRRQ